MFDLITFDVTISEKSNQMRKKLENINKELGALQIAIQNSLKSDIEILNINFVNNF